MPYDVFGFLLADIIFLISFVILVVRGFMTRVAWGFIVLLAPFGIVAFSIKHWSEVGKYFILYLVSFAACVALVFMSPTMIALYVRSRPVTASLFKAVNPSAYEESQKLPIANHGQPQASPTPREVRDLAENEAPLSATPPPDPNSTPRGEYVKHARALNILYQQLNAERPKLKPGSPAVAAFNAKAAHYQQGLASLDEEKKRLDALDHASNLNAEAAAALGSLQTSANTGDYEAFAATLKKSLSDHRQTPVFPQIVAFARVTLQQTTPEKVAAALQNKAGGAARAEFDKTTRQVQGIVNQTPPIVVPPPGSTEVYKYGYHPGASKPDYNNDNLIGTREIWKGEYAYIDGVPGVFYRSADCEFNPQTKYFYLSRTVPKKRLSDAEYKELTRLYHLLGQQEKAMADAPPPAEEAKQVSSELDDLRKQLGGYAMK